MTGRPRRVPVQQAGALSMSEDDFQDRVIATAKLNHWRLTHFRAVKLPSGRWGIPLQGDSGFPDLALARAGVVLLAELKRSRAEKPRPGQVEWLREIGPEIGRLWCPEDWPEILAELSRPVTRMAPDPSL